MPSRILRTKNASTGDKTYSLGLIHLQDPAPVMRANGSISKATPSQVGVLSRGERGKLRRHDRVLSQTFPGK